MPCEPIPYNPYLVSPTARRSSAPYICCRVADPCPLTDKRGSRKLGKGQEIADIILRCDELPQVFEPALPDLFQQERQLAAITEFGIRDRTADFERIKR